MAEPIDDLRIKSEVMRMLGNLVSKANEHDSKFEGIRDQLNLIRSDLTTVSGQFSDVGSMALKDNVRINDLEGRVTALESEAH